MTNTLPNKKFDSAIEGGGSRKAKFELHLHKIQGGYRYETAPKISLESGNTYCRFSSSMCSYSYFL